MCISYWQRETIERRLKENDFDRNMFDQIQATVFDNMFFDSYHRYINSKSWSSVEAEEDTQHTQTKRFLVIMDLEDEKKMEKRANSNKTCEIQNGCCGSNMQDFSNDEFWQLIHTEDGFESFQEYAEQHNSKETLDLWLLIEELGKFDPEIDAERIHLQAREIYDSYISANASIMQIGGVSEVMRSELLEELEKNANRDMYSTIQGLCYTTMKNNVFLKYRRSEEWRLLQYKRHSNPSFIRRLAICLGRLNYSARRSRIVPLRNRSIDYQTR